jgi:hypothetical protein
MATFLLDALTKKSFGYQCVFVSFKRPIDLFIVMKLMPCDEAVNLTPKLEGRAVEHVPIRDEPRR